jgi:S1-C subfamily serine protease
MARSLYRRIWIPCALATLVACAGPASSPDGVRIEAPQSLAFPYPLPSGLDFPDYRAAAERDAGIYVRVRVYSDRPEDLEASPGGGIANANLSYASGILADAEGDVVTAAHVANSTRYKADVITLDGRRYRGRVVAVERGHELGLIRIAPFPGMEHARFATEPPPEGAPVLAIGTPAHHGGIVSVGVVLRPRLGVRIHYADYGYDDAIAVAMRIESGNSGGPLIDRTGAVVGMIASNYSAEIGLAVPARAIAAFLDAHRGD